MLSNNSVQDEIMNPLLSLILLYYYIHAESRPQLQCTEFQVHVVLIGIYNTMPDSYNTYTGRHRNRTVLDYLNGGMHEIIM